MFTPPPVLEPKFLKEALTFFIAVLIFLYIIATVTK
jgi:hypothetical protein